VGQDYQSPRDVTRILSDLRAGNSELVDRLLPLVYEELRELAHRRLYFERPGHTLNTTALVHEAYIKLVGQDRVVWKNRNQFLAIASQAMRRILVDHARKHRAGKRGGGAESSSLDDVPELHSRDRGESLIALDEALKRLARLDERQSRVVECRYFGGMSVEETAHYLGISSATVKRDWMMARAWLYNELKDVRLDV
jgi:RNA polymerase sigma-70 factor, ECF subfamily